MSETKHCPVCGREVHLASPRAVYCSEECKVTMQIRREKERLRNDPAAREAHNEACRQRRARMAGGQGPDRPLNAPRLCPGGPWNHGKCGHKAAYESRWCAKCQEARRKYYGLAWEPSDAAAGFAGGEVEHEVAI